MGTREKLFDARIGLPALADELKNISRARQLTGISRTHYDIKDAFERYGRDGLAPKERRRPRRPNETPPELVAHILEMTRRVTPPTATYGSRSSSACWRAGQCRFQLALGLIPSRVVTPLHCPTYGTLGKSAHEGSGGRGVFLQGLPLCKQGYRSGQIQVT